MCGSVGWIVAVGLSVGNSGCEGCDFSFGPIPVQVFVDGPDDRPVTVRICTESDDSPDGWRCGDQIAEAGFAAAEVGWHGYTTCKHPELLVEAEAEGCEPASQTRPRQRPETTDRVPVVFRLALACP